MDSQEWPEVSLALKERRRELTLSGTEINDRLKSGTLDFRLFKLVELNFLEISNSLLEELPEDIKALVKMKNLALQGNKLKALPDGISSFQSIGFLDVSNNLMEALTPSINSCVKIQTLNISSNKITFLPDMSRLQQLAFLHIDNNQIGKLPEELCTLQHLSELYASKNKIDALPSKIGELKALRVLDLSDNCLTEIPSELSDCLKLKDLNLKNNPLKDNRLKKMDLQCSTKAVMTYLAQCSSKGKGKGKKGKKKQEKDKMEADEDDGEDLETKRKIFVHLHTDQEKKVLKKDIVKDIRPHITCIIVKRLDLSNETVFKNFLKLQTKLHENLCEGRTVATIATHSLERMSLPLVYDACAPEELKIKALGRSEVQTGQELVTHLHQEKEKEKQKKKRQVKTGLYKYLDLLDGQSLYASLRDASGTVVSFPPITNSEDTKIKCAVDDILIEVTSPVSLPKCRMVLESLIRDMFEAGFESKPTDDNEAELHGLDLEQIRVVDDEGNLMNVFPSNLDLDFGDVIPVVRK